MQSGAVAQNPLEKAAPESAAAAGSAAQPAAAVDKLVAKFAQAAIGEPSGLQIVPLDRAIAEFFQRTRASFEQVKKHGIPPELAVKIKLEDVIKIFESVLMNEKSISEDLIKFQNAIYYKDEKKQLRKVSIFDDLDGQFIFIIETKRKLADGTKDWKMPLFQGATKTGKICWRVDCYPPQPWVNMVVKEYSHGSLACQEAEFSQLFAKATRADSLHNYVLARCVDSKELSPNLILYKQPLYSPLAFCNLYELLFVHKIKLSAENTQSIIKTLLCAIKEMHDKGYAHQDIKLENILVYKTAKGDYSIKLSDYSLIRFVPSNNQVAKSTKLHASPELLFAYNKEHMQQYKKMRKTKNDETRYKKLSEFSKQLYPNDCYASSLVKQLGNAIFDKTQDYTMPHLANDMWAAGITIAEILLEQVDIDYRDHDRLVQHPLLAGLLAPDRNKRLTVDQAIALWEKVQPAPAHKVARVQL